MSRNSFLFVCVFTYSNTFRLFDQKMPKMWFSWTKSNFWLFFVNNSENLRLCAKTKMLELNILYMIKVAILIWSDYFFEFLVSKTAQNPPNWTVRNHRFSKNSDIFLHLMLLLLPMHLFLNLHWEYVLQITDKHLYTMSNTIYIFIFWRNMNKNEI